MSAIIITTENDSAYKNLLDFFNRAYHIPIYPIIEKTENKELSAKQEHDNLKEAFLFNSKTFLHKHLK